MILFLLQSYRRRPVRRPFNGKKMCSPDGDSGHAVVSTAPVELGWGLSVLPVPVRVMSGCCGFLLQSKNMQETLNSDFKSVCHCRCEQLSLYVRNVVNWWCRLRSVILFIKKKKRLLWVTHFPISSVTINSSHNLKGCAPLSSGDVVFLPLDFAILFYIDNSPLQLQNRLQFCLLSIFKAQNSSHSFLD